MTNTEPNTALNNELTVNDIRELRDEDGEFSLYARGHHASEKFMTVVNLYLDQEYGYDEMYVEPGGVRYGWARFVPTQEYGFHQVFVDVGSKVRSGRGVFSYTATTEVLEND